MRTSNSVAAPFLLHHFRCADRVMLAYLHIVDSFAVCIRVANLAFSKANFRNLTILNVLHFGTMTWLFVEVLSKFRFSGKCLIHKEFHELKPVYRAWHVHTRDNFCHEAPTHQFHLGVAMQIG